MKKTDIALIAIVVLLVVVGVLTLGKSEENKIEYELPLTLTGEAGLTELTYSEYEEKLNSEDPFIFIVERTNCTYCQQYMPIVEEFVSKYNIPIYYVNTENITSDEFNSLVKSNSFFKKNSEWGTPTTMILIGTEAIDYVQGLTDADGLYDFLNEYTTLETND